MIDEVVEFHSNGTTANGYLARPDGEGRHPGVVVIQEWWGLEEHIKDVARRFAAEGFVALAPDLYHGQITTEPDEALKLVMGLNREEAAKDMAGAIDYLKRLRYVAPPKVGMVGFCMGGSLTLMMACRNSDLGAAADFYGGAAAGAAHVRELQCPLFGAFGAEDESIPQEHVEAIRDAALSSGQPVEIVVYPAPHAFFNDTRAAYRAGPATEAWQKTLALFRQHLTA